MKVIDIMQKIANGEIFKFRVDDIDYYVDKKNYIREALGEGGRIVEWYIDEKWLNTEAEIIEEDKKIKPLINCVNAITPNDMTSYYEKEELEDIVKQNFYVIHKKINEIIDYINKEEQ